MENIVFNYAGPWNNILPLKREQKINILLIVHTSVNHGIRENYNKKEHLDFSYLY